MCSSVETRQMLPPTGLAGAAEALRVGAPPGMDHVVTWEDAASTSRSASTPSNLAASSSLAGSGTSRPLSRIFPVGSLRFSSRSAATPRANRPARLQYTARCNENCGVRLG